MAFQFELYLPIKMPQRMLQAVGHDRAMTKMPQIMKMAGNMLPSAQHLDDVGPVELLPCRQYGP